MTSSAPIDPTFAQMGRICALLSMARERCRATKTAEVYEITVQPCRDMIRAKIERNPSTIFDAAFDIACEFDQRGEEFMMAWIYAAAADLIEEAQG